MSFPHIPEEKKIELIKRAINSLDGWKALAQSIKDRPDSKNQCIELLRKIGGDSEIDLDENTKVSFTELLIEQLEIHLTKLDEEE